MEINKVMVAGRGAQHWGKGGLMRGPTRRGGRGRSARRGGAGAWGGGVGGGVRVSPDSSNRVRLCGHTQTDKEV